MRRDADAVVERVLAQARGRAEMYLALGRAFLTAFSMIRFFAVGSLSHAGGVERALVVVPVSAAALLLSLWVLLQSSERRSSLPLLGASVGIDATLAFVALLSNVLWPWSGYQGILRVPDASFVLIVTLSTGLRVSPRLAIFGALLNLSLTVALLRLDAVRNAGIIAYAARDVGLHLMHVAFSGLGAWFFSLHSRRLALASARETLRAERASQGLLEMLEEHHHVRSVVSAASINAEHVVRQLSREPDAAEPSPALTAAHALEHDLRDVRAMLSEVQQRADAARMTAIEPELVDVADLLRRWTPVLVRRFPGMRLECRIPEGEHRAWIAGGAVALERVLVNLALNAMEGDGKSGANELTVAVEESPHHLTVRCVDDGPGLGAESPEWLLERGVSRKPHSSGLGLFFVNAVVGASGGQLQLSNRTAGGTEVRVQLRR
jgi:signal transduction histidine kinase